MSTGMPERNHARDLVGQLLRSITPLTGGLAGGLGVAVPILGGDVLRNEFWASELHCRPGDSICDHLGRSCRGCWSRRRNRDSAGWWRAHDGQGAPTFA